MNIFSPFLIFPLRKFSPFRDYVYYTLVDRNINFFDVSIGNEELRITGMQPYKLDSSTESGLIYPVILNRDFTTNQSVNHGRPQVTGANTYSLSVLTFLRTHSASILNTTVSASFVNSSGKLQYVRSNQPRFDRGRLNGITIDTSAMVGLLMEPGRSNIAFHSTNFSSTSAPNSNVIFTPLADIAPDSSTLSSTVSTNLNNTAILYLTGCNNGLINRRYTISFFIKAPTISTQFSFRQHPLHQGSTINFTFERVVNAVELDRVIVLSRSNPTDKVYVEKYPPDDPFLPFSRWYRICYTTVANANNARLWPGISVFGGTRQFSIWGLQIEEGDTPTSYIPVNGFVGTRGADVLSLSGANLWSIYSSTPISNVTPNSATIYIESRKKYLSETPETLLQFTDRNLTTYNTIIYTTNSTNISSNLFNTNLLLNVANTWVNTDVKTAFSYNNISKKITLASDSRTTTGTTTNSIQLSGIQFGSNYSGHIRKLFIFPESISTADLQILTT